ncbi:MAG: hypothetical protein ACJATA_000349 [Sphingobacteriales bacterium]
MGYYAGIDNFKLTDCHITNTLIAPMTIADSTTELLSNIIYEVSLIDSGDWVFDIFDADFDSDIIVSTSCNFTDTLGYDDDFCGLASKTTIAGLDTGIYFVKISNKTQFSKGNFNLNIHPENLGDYCLGFGTNQEIFIVNTQMEGDNGGFNQPSGYNRYKFFENQISEVSPGSGYQITTNNTVGNRRFEIYADWNNDNNFEDGGETIFINSGPSPYLATITPPANKTSGLKRLRIVTNTGTADPGSFGPKGFGEVEDYQIRVKALSSPPTAKNDSSSKLFETAINISVLDNDEDGALPKDINSVTIKNGPSNGTAEPVMLAGTVDYTPNNGFIGLDTFIYTVKDIVAQNQIKRR